MPTPLIVAADDRPSPLHMVGEEITVLADSGQTGSYEIFRQSGPEGSGPPPHSHPWDEAFYVIDGDVAFALGDQQELVARAGTLVHIPGGTVHWFRFGASGAVMLSVTSKEGASEFFTQVDHEISPTEPDLGALAGIATSHGLTVPVPSA